MKLAPIILLSLILFSCTQSKDKPVSPRVNHVMLYVSNLDASVDFYTRAFDLQETNRVTQLKVTKADGSQLTRDIEIVFLKFAGQDFVYELAQNPSPPDSLGRGLFQHVGVDVMDIETALKRALEAGGELVAPVQLVSTKDINVKQAFLRGPDGESIELMQMITGEF